MDTKHLVIGRSDVHAVAAVMRSRDMSGSAAVVASYEQALAGYFGTRRAVACSSGTAAVHLALLALGVEAGHEVIVPATAPAMTALPVLAVGARPVFADIAGRDTFALDLAGVEARLTRATRAVVSVPMWGYPADGPELVAACQGWRLPLIEDAAQAHGATVDGRLIGAQGRVGVFSTHARKLICTGEGGFCLTDDEALAGRLAQLRNLGQPPGGGGFGTGFGLNYKLPAVSAALGSTQLARLPRRVADRGRIACRLADTPAAVDGITLFPVRERGTANHYALLVTAAADRAGRLGRAWQAAGIVSDTIRYGYRPLYEAPVFRAAAGGPCPNAEQLCTTLLTLPCHEGVTRADEQRIVAVCRTVMSS